MRPHSAAWALVVGSCTEIVRDPELSSCAEVDDGGWRTIAEEMGRTVDPSGPRMVIDLLADAEEEGTESGRRSGGRRSVTPEGMVSGSLPICEWRVGVVENVRASGRVERSRVVVVFMVSVIVCEVRTLK